MESSFASESLQLSKVQLDPNPSPASIDDVLDEDGSFWGGSGEELDQESDLDWEWERRRKHFHNIGYRDGLIAGKEASAQDGFNIGFKQSVIAGCQWGNCRGVTSSLACLPDRLREKLIDTKERRNEFQALHKSVHSLSTTDALKLFHDDIATEKAVESSGDAEATSDKDCLQNQSSDSCLRNYVEKLHSLLLESPTMDSHLSVK